MASEIKIDLNLTGEQAVARGLDNVGDKAEHAGDDLNKMAKEAGFLDKRLGELRGEINGLIKEFDKTGDKDILKQIKIDQRELSSLSQLNKQISEVRVSGQKASDGLEKFGYSAKILDQRIMNLRGNLRAMARQFSQTGDVDILRKIKTGKGDLDALTQLRKQLTGLMGDVGAEAGGMFGDAITKSMMALRGPAIIALVAAVAAATPFIGATISAAVLGGVGLGGIAGGIALAAKDARVQDSWAALAEHASAAFTKAAEPMVKPVLGAIAVIDQAVDGISGSLRDAFQGVGPILVPLTKGLTGLIEKMMPGVVLAMNRARPLLLVIGDELPKIGHALSIFLQQISRDPRGAIAAFQDLSKIIQFTLVLTGRFLEGLSILWATISPMIKIAMGDTAGAVVQMAAMEQAMRDANDIGGDLTGGLEDLAGSANEANNKMMALNQAFLDFLGIARSAEKANIGYERTWDEMIETLTKGKRTLDITTEAGRTNREAIEAHADAIAERHRQRMEEGMALEQSLPLMDAEIEKLRAQLLQLGYNKQAADELINMYTKWPTKAVTVIEAQGLEATKESVQELISLFRLANNITIGGIGGAKIGGKRAAGGPVLAGQTYLVGEQGPEVLTMGSTNGHVTNATQTAAMMSGASGGASQVVLNVTPQYTGVPLMDVLMAAFAERLRVTNGAIGQFRVPRVA